MIAGLAKDACLFQNDARVTSEEGKAPSQWAVMTRAGTDVSALRSLGWAPRDVDPNARVWTDHYSSVVSVLDFGVR